MNDTNQARRARRVLWGVVLGIMVLNIILIVLVLRGWQGPGPNPEPRPEDVGQNPAELVR